MLVVWQYGLNLPPVFPYILLQCDKWQQRDSLTKWCLTWKCRWSKGVELNSSTWKNHTYWQFIDICWMFLEPKQWARARWDSGLCISSMITVMWNTSHVLEGHADFYKCGMQALVHCRQKCIANGDGCVEKWCFVDENLLSQIVLLLSLYVL